MYMSIKIIHFFVTFPLNFEYFPHKYISYINILISCSVSRIWMYHDPVTQILLLELQVFLIYDSYKEITGKSLIHTTLSILQIMKLLNKGCGSPSLLLCLQIAYVNPYWHQPGPFPYMPGNTNICQFFKYLTKAANNVISIWISFFFLLKRLNILKYSSLVI